MNYFEVEILKVLKYDRFSVAICSVLSQFIATYATAMASIVESVQFL